MHVPKNHRVVKVMLLSVVRRRCTAISTATGTKETQPHIKTAKSQARPFKEIPGPRGYPLLGNVLDYTRFGHKKIAKLHVDNERYFKTYGKIFKERFGPSLYMVYISDPEDIATVFRHEGPYPARGFDLKILETYYKRKGRPLSIGIGNGKQWYDRRKLTHKKMLQPQSSKLYLGMQSDVTDDFVSYLKEIIGEQKRSVDIQTELSRYTMESIGYVCFNMRLNVLGAKTSHDAEAQMYADSVTKFFELLGNQMISIPFYQLFKTPRYMEFEKLYDHVLEYPRVLLSKSMEKEANERDNAAEGRHFVSELLAAGETIENAADSAVALFIAGVESTANSMAFLLYNIARNPDKQEKLRDEVSQVLPKGGPITADHLNHLQYTKACVKESMRLYFPVVSGPTRVLTEDVVLSGYHIPKGTCLVMCNNFSCLQPDYFANSTSFYPERWLRSDSPLPNPYIHLPFGFGTRMCLGRRFAEQQLYIGICKLLQGFNIQYTGSEEIGINYSLFGTPDRPLNLSFSPRYE